MPAHDAVRIFSHRKTNDKLTYGELVDAARRAASYYQARGLRRGSIIALIGGHDLAFYGTWLGALWIGAIPVVLAEPSVRIDKQIYWSRLAYLLTYVEVELLALSAGIEVAKWPVEIPIASYDEIVRDAGPGPAPEPVVAEDDEVLLLQHSSGTTGIPKGILVTHGMATRNVVDYIERMGITSSDVLATWLPLYHDLGMVCNFLVPLYAGSTVVWLSPFEWVVGPDMLLDAITKHRATFAQMPNFAFALLAATVRDPRKFDLSSVRAMMSGGEPLNAEHMVRFARHFEPAGLRASCLGAGYGMAENVGAIAHAGPTTPSKYHRVRKHDWEVRHVAVPAGEGEDPSETLTHVSNSTLLPGYEIRVVDAGGAALPPGHAGRLFLKAPCLFKGYHRREDLTAALFDDDGFFDTGDVGYLDDDGHVYVTGRLKDLIIVGGRNVYAQDVEAVANEVPGVHPGRNVCFGVTLPSYGTEGAVLLVESDEPEADWPAVVDRVRAAVARRADVDLFDARVVPRGALRKSTAGKLARPDNRAWYLEGRFGPLPRQLARDAGR